MDVMLHGYSFPVALARHRFKAKVAPELANAGYCLAIIMMSVSILLDVLNLVLCHVPNTLELLVQVILSKFAHSSIEIYGDKAYKLPDEEDIYANKSLVVYTPITERAV